MNFLKIILITFLFISCATNKQSRIKEKEKDFLGYPPEVQGQIQAEQIDKNFTEDQVYLAKGKPGEVSKHEKAGKIITTWKYFGKPDVVAPAGSNAPGFSGAYEYPSQGPGTPPKQAYPMYYSKPKLTVEFEDGKVKSWREN